MPCTFGMLLWICVEIRVVVQTRNDFPPVSPAENAGSCVCMRTLEQMREHPDLAPYTDEQLMELRDSLYALARLLLRLYQQQHGSTAVSEGSLSDEGGSE